LFPAGRRIPKQYVAKEKICAKMMSTVESSLHVKTGSSLQDEAAVSEASHGVSTGHREQEGRGQI